MTDEELIARLRETLQNIADGDVPRIHATPWFPDGRRSKHDKCPHGRWMYEDCDECTSEYARDCLATLTNAAPAGSVE